MDLWIDSFSTQTPLAPGATAELMVMVGHSGTAPIQRAAIELRLCEGPCDNANTLLTLFGAATIVPNASTLVPMTLTIPAQLPSDVYELVAFVDPSNALPEEDESNNASAPLRISNGTLELTPAIVSFGSVPVGCAVERTMSIRNSGTTSVVLQGLAFVPPLSSEIALVSGFGPVTLAPGEIHVLTLRYSPTDSGDDTGNLRIETDDATSPVLTVGLAGTGVPPQLIEDVLEQTKRVDVLFVVDNSGSMADEQQQLSNAIPVFLGWASTNGVDYRAAVTTMDASASSTWGHFVGNVAVVSPQTPTPIPVLQTNTQVGTNGSGIEQGLRMMMLALSEPLLSGGNRGFLRQEAGLAVVFLSDEDDQSPGPTSDYEAFLTNLKGQGRYVANVIGGPLQGSSCFAEDPIRYAELAAQTGGTVVSICDSDWAPALTDFGGPSFGLLDRVSLSGAPAPGSLEVLVDSLLVPEIGAGGDRNWRYESGENAVVFEPGAIPSAGATILVRFGVQCGP